MINEYYSFVKELTAESSRIINSYFGKPSIGFDKKADDSPVTVADRETELALRALIQKKFPKHGIIGEEFDSVRENAEYVWILDPIDGTKSFTTNVPLFTTLICLTRNGKPVLGVIHQPVLNVLVIGDGNVTYCNDEVVKVGNKTKISDAVLLTTDTRDIAVYNKPVSNWNSLVDDVYLLRTWGDAYGYYLLATGWADIMVDPKVNLWDFMPLIPIIRGAGGVITDWEGNDPIGKDSIVAANAALHKQVIEYLNR